MQTTPLSMHAIQISIVYLIDQKQDSAELAKWFSENYMKLNEDKCLLMIFGNKCKDSAVTIGNSIIKESDSGKLLGVNFDKKFSFTKHVEDLCKKANQTLHALACLSNYSTSPHIRTYFLRERLK